jgi:hypothetical protein
VIAFAAGVSAIKITQGKDKANKASVPYKCNKAMAG